MTMSILGHYNNFFFAAHLLDIAMGFKTLRTILSSVTHNGKQVWKKTKWARWDWVPALVFPYMYDVTGVRWPRHAVPLCSWFWRWACWLWWCISTPWWPSTSSESSTTRVKTESRPTWSVTTCWLWVVKPPNACYEVLTCWLWVVNPPNAHYEVWTCWLLVGTSQCSICRKKQSILRPLSVFYSLLQY